MAGENQKGFWDYATPILTGVGAAAATGLYNNYAVNKQNAFNAVEAEKQRQYETMMSNTAYQRQAADMAAAGLNPHLAGGQGGSSTPTGVAATGAQAMPLDVAGAINAASNAAFTKAQIGNMNADTKLKEQQSGKTKAETTRTEVLTEIEPILIKAQAKLATAQGNKAKQETLTEVQRTAQAGWEQLQASMDYKKRNWGYEKELELYKKQLEIELFEAGFDATTAGRIISTVGKSVNAISPFTSFVSRGKKE